MGGTQRRPQRLLSGMTGAVPEISVSVASRVSGISASAPRSGSMTPPSALSRHGSRSTQPQLGSAIMPIVRKKGSLAHPVSGFGNDLEELHVRILGGSALP